MRYFIDYGCALVELTFDEITQRYEWRDDYRWSHHRAGNSIYLVKRF